MKADILTFSQTGNTLKAGTSIGNGLQAGGLDVHHVNFLRRRKWAPGDAQLIGIGCPVFENRPAEVVPDFLENCGDNLTGKKAFVFITSGGSPAKSLWHLAQSVGRTGAAVIGGIQLRGTSTFPTIFGVYPGRPNAAELGRADAFGRAVADNMITGEKIPDQYKINYQNGGRFYNIVGPCLNSIKKITTPLPECDTDKCTLCGNCVNECPSGSIRVEDKAVRFKNSCIVCYRCWHVCPEDAVSIRFSPGDGLIERLCYAEQMERLFGDLKPDEQVGPNLYRDVLARKIKLKYDRKNPTAEYEYREE